MFIFIVPLKSQKVSSDWSAFSKLVERSLKSICNQTSDNFKVIVSCHELPETNYKNDKITFHQVSFPPPELKGLDNETARRTKEGDKANKILEAIPIAKSFNPNYVMVVDSDDCINRKIVEHVEKNSNDAIPGWYFNKGYYYQEGKRYAFLNKGNFNKFCGSCIIIKASLLKEIFLEEPFLYYDHFSMKLPDGTPLNKFPLVGAMYSVGNGENHLMSVQKAVSIAKSATKFWPSLRAKLKKYRIKLITPNFKKIYGFYRL